MKILFLDHQGVMYIKKHPNPGKLDLFDEECIKTLNTILSNEPDLEIVVSSDWKLWVSLEEIQFFYKKQGILKSPISYTSYLDRINGISIAQHRSQEIMNWLKDKNIDKWVSVDDIDMKRYLEHFVYISDPNIGIKNIGIKYKILEILN